MQDKLPIIINTNAVLNVYIDKSNAVASIINNGGATIRQIQLQTGDNTIDISQYLNKNYSIRVANDSNVVVQKI